MSRTALLDPPFVAPDEIEIRFADTAADMAAVFELRRRVFGDEQGIADAGVSDSEDSRSLHVLALIPDGAIGTGRLTPPSVERPEAHIAWVATLPGYRCLGVGGAMMRALLAAADEAHFPVVLLSAQTHALAFYRRLGFLPYGNRFVVRGIEHQFMARYLPGTIPGKAPR